jgi:hypothetical protein
MNNKTVKSIDSFECKDWLLNKHYAKRMCSISFAFGLFDSDNILQGVCTFGSPPSRALCVGVCGINNAHKVLELNRFIINKNESNIASFFISRCLKLLPKDLIIVSYADTSKNHHGYIYQATNWIYTGLSAKRTERYDVDNPNKHSKSVTEKKGIKYQDLAVRERPQKHRYIYFTGSKTQKKHLKNQLMYKECPYPKGDNLNYDASYIPMTQTKLF